MTLELDPNMPRGLFSYDSYRPRQWRPDLVGLGLLWLATVPDSDLQEFFIGFATGPHGEFMARFRMAPRLPGKPTQTVTFTIDHDLTLCNNDHSQWGGRRFVGYTRQMLYCAANIHEPTNADLTP